MNQNQMKKIALHLERIIPKLNIPNDDNPIKKTLKELVGIAGILAQMNGIAPLGITVGLVFTGMGAFDMAALPDATIDWEKVFIAQLESINEDSKI